MKTPEVIRIKNVFAGYDGQTVLEDISFNVYEHDFLGIIGPNGGGKTTLLKIIVGLIKPESGEVAIYDRPPREARALIGYVPQMSLFDKEFPISVQEVVLLGRLSRIRRLGRFSGEDYESCEKALETVEMEHLKDKQIGQLSGGQRQRVFIARALAQDPKILILDEPTSSIDKPMQAGLYELLEKLKRKRTIILVSHDIGAVSSCVTKIACLNKKIFYHDSAEITSEQLETVYGCPVDLIAHGVPHRVLKDHKHHD